LVSLQQLLMIFHFSWQPTWWGATLNGNEFKTELSIYVPRDVPYSISVNIYN
jgi:hypothetical protein